MTTIRRAHCFLRTLHRRLVIHRDFARFRRYQRRRGRTEYSDAAMMLGVLANERTKWTREPYEVAALAEVPKVRESGLVARRDIDRVEALLKESVVIADIASRPPHQQEEGMP